MGVLRRVFLVSLLIPALALAQTPNMTLYKPSPGVTSGPTWAQMLNTALDTVDAHDHSAGKGKRITPSGLNISSDLECNGNDITELRTARFEAQGAALTDPADARSIYAVGDNLYYNNGSGAAVQITSGSSVVSSISGAFSTQTPGSFPYSVTSGDAQRVVLVDTTSARTLNLPAATTAILFMVKDTAGQAAANNITLARSGTDTIDGTAGNKLLALNSGWWVVISNGVNGWVTAAMLGVSDAAEARTNIGVGSGDSPTMTGLTLSGLTASRWVKTNSGKALISSTLAQSDVTGLTTADSPSLTGLTLSGLTASRWVKTDGSKALSSSTLAQSDVTGLTTADSPTFTGATFSGLTASQYVKTTAGKALTSASSIPNTDITGLGTMATATATDYLSKAGNLSGIADAATARSNISAAKSGANSDITSITGVTSATWDPGSLTTDSGSATGVSYESRYQKLGKFVMFSIDINVNVTGSPGRITFALPTTAVNTRKQAGGCHVDDGSYQSGTWIIETATPTKADIRPDASSWDTGNGKRITCNGFYEEA